MHEFFNIPESVINTLIGGACGILVAYLTARVKNSKPKNGFVDTAFDALEKVAKRTDQDNVRLRGENEALAKEKNDLMMENNRLKRRRQ